MHASSSEKVLVVNPFTNHISKYIYSNYIEGIHGTDTDCNIHTKYIHGIDTDCNTYIWLTLTLTYKWKTMTSLLVYWWIWMLCGYNWESCYFRCIFIRYVFFCCVQKPNEQQSPCVSESSIEPSHSVLVLKSTRCQNRNFLPWTLWFYGFNIGML